MVVEVLVMGKEAQSQQSHPKIGVHIQYRIVADHCLVLRTELSGGGIKDGRIVGTEIAEIDSYLCIHGVSEP